MQKILIKPADGGLTLAFFTSDGKGVTTMFRIVDAMRNFKKVYTAIQGGNESVLSPIVNAMVDNFVDRISDPSSNKTAMHSFGPVFVLAKVTEFMFRVFTLCVRPLPLWRNWLMRCIPNIT